MKFLATVPVISWNSSVEQLNHFNTIAGNKCCMILIQWWGIGSYLSGAMCRFVYGPADAIANHWLVLVLARPGNPGQSPEGHKTDVCLCCITNTLPKSQKKINNLSHKTTANILAAPWTC